MGVYECFVHRQLRTTMDVACPEYLDFVHGGLQMQITHHVRSFLLVLPSPSPRRRRRPATSPFPPPPVAPRSPAPEPQLTLPFTALPSPLPPQPPLRDSARQGMGQGEQGRVQGEELPAGERADGEHARRHCRTMSRAPRYGGRGAEGKDLARVGRRAFDGHFRPFSLPPPSVIPYC